MAGPRSAPEVGRYWGWALPSYISFQQRPASLPSAGRSFPSCPTAVPAPPGTWGKLRPSTRRPLDALWGAGSHGRRGRARCRVLEEARWLPRPLARARSRACRQPWAAGEWGEERRLREGGDWRRGQGRGSAGRAAGGGQPQGAGAPRGGLGAAASRRLASAPEAPPLSPGLRAGSVRCPESGILGKLEGMLAGVEGSVCAGSRDAARARPRAPRGTSVLRTAGLRVSPGG